MEHDLLERVIVSPIAGVFTPLAHQTNVAAGAAVTDVDRKVQLWDGAFDDDLAAFSPAGPTSPDTGFLEVVPTRALILRSFGTAGREEWRP